MMLVTVVVTNLRICVLPFYSMKLLLSQMQRQIVIVENKMHSLDYKLYKSSIWKQYEHNDRNWTTGYKLL